MGKRIGQYEIKKTLGSWKGVSCHLGVHRSSQKKAVLKVLVKDAAPGHSENCLSLLRGEAELSSSLDFPGIVPILETGEVPEGIYVAMGYESGPTLETFLKEKAPLSPEQAAFLGLEIAKALAHGHGRGIFHRNLKTSNIFLRKGPSAAVADFSLARAPDPMDPASTGVAFSRHPRFLAPEQVRGDYDMVDQRTDIYSLGVVLYEMLTGQDPFEGDKPGSIQYKILKTTPRPPRAVVRSVPKDLDAITRKCMQRQIHLRYWSMAEAALDLMRFLEGKPVSALEGQSLGGKLRVAARGRRGVVIAAVAAGALGLAAFLMLQSGGKAPEPAAEGRAAVRDHGGGKDEGSLRKKLKAALTNGLAQGVLNRRIEPTTHRPWRTWGLPRSSRVVSSME
jgi:serine/threonine-protein kinase